MSIPIKEITEQNYGRELQLKMTLYTFYHLERKWIVWTLLNTTEFKFSKHDLLQNKAKYSLIKRKVLNLLMIVRNLTFWIFEVVAKYLIVTINYPTHVGLDKAKNVTAMLAIS